MQRKPHLSKKAIMLACIGGCFALAATLSACAPKEPAVVEKDPAPEPIVTIDWSPTTDCSTCHTIESDSAKDASSFTGIHQQQGLTCTGCHTDEAALKKAHESARKTDTAPSALKQTKFVDADCSNESCHVLAPEDFIALTATSDQLTDDKKTRVNPHEVATMTPGHIEAGMTCADCHDAHKSKTAFDYCLSCHHEGVFECGTCHAH